MEILFIDERLWGQLKTLLLMYAAQPCPAVCSRQPRDPVTLRVLYLFLELGQLARQQSHQRDGVFQLLLQAAHFILLAFSLAAHQGHGSHAGEPLQVLLLSGPEGEKDGK